VSLILRKELGGSWETIRGFLKDDLDQIEQQLNLPIDLTEISGNLPESALPKIDESTLLGRGAGEGHGAAEQINLGPGLLMSGKILQVDIPAVASAARAGGGGRSTQGDRGPMGPPGPQGPAGSGSGSTLAWTLLTNGDSIEPELIFDSFGDVIWMNVP
jgi:hypothetical protein